MRRIDEVRNRKMRDIQFAQILDKKRIRFVFTNGQEITVCAYPEDYGGDTAIYIEKDNI